MQLLSTCKLRLATYNVRNYFDAHDDPLTRDDPNPKDPASATAVAQIISESRADVVALQEIETLQELENLRGRQGLTDTYPYLVLIDGNDTRGTDVALMSRYPLSRVKSHKDEIIGTYKGRDLKFRRDLLQADVALPNNESLRVFVTHYIMKRNSWCDDRRLEEAEATHEILTRESREYPVMHTVVMGDCNDTVGSATLNALTAPNEERTLHNISDGTPHSWGHWKNQAQKYGGSARFDHILTTSSLYLRTIEHGIIEGTAALRASDHNLVYADFLLTA